MSPSQPSERSFDCEFCQGVIKIPYDLAPTKAPCPYCAQEVMSPPPSSPSGALAPSSKDFEAAPKLVPTPSPVISSKTEVPQLVEIGGGLKPVPKRGGETSSGGVPTEPPSIKASPPPVPAPEEKERVSNKTAALLAASGKETQAEPESKSGTSLKDDEVAPESLLVGESRKKMAGGKVSRKKEKITKPKASPAKSKVRPLIYFGAGLAVVLLGLLAIVLLNRPGEDAKKPVVRVNNSPEATRMKFLRDGWKQSATEVMEAFLKAETIEEKAKFVVGGESRIPEMSEFYREREVADMDTPLQAFSHEDLVMEDKERGLFLMRYDRPAQFAMNEFFRPVAPLEVQYKTEEPDALLATAADLDNFAMDPVRILAFFKGEGESLKLDWDVFVQTKHRLLKQFLEAPSPGSRHVFRVRIHEDVPSVKQDSAAEVRYYRVIDPANDDDFCKIPVVVDSALGKHLSTLNWVGVESAKISSRGATVELAWSDDEEPRVYIKRLLCWEYLGLGGVMGNLRLNPDADTVNLGVDRIPDDG